MDYFPEYDENADVKAKIIKVEEEKKGFNTKKIYYFKCQKCGAEYSRRKVDNRMQPYCKGCKKIYDNEVHLMLKKERQQKAAEREKRIRLNTLNDLWKLAISKYDEFLSLEDLSNCIDEIEEMWNE